MHTLRICGAAFAVLLAVGCGTDNTGAEAGNGSSSSSGGVTTDGGGDQDGAVEDGGVADAGAEDSGVTDAGAADTGVTDAGGTEDSGDDKDTGWNSDIKVCKFGEVKCQGAKLATCNNYEDGWIISNCFPGQTCSAGKCVPVDNNLIVVFDSSGSMTAKVTMGCWCGSGCSKDKKQCPAFLCKGTSPTGCQQKPCSSLKWPTCDPSLGCSRMDISKMVFSQALDKINANTTRMAMFRFPQKLKKGSSFASCTSGYYQGQSFISGESSPGPKDQQAATANSTWFWPSLNETLCVEFPPDGNFPTKAKMKKWMDGTEKQAIVGSCSNPSSICKSVLGCKGTCCSGQCYAHTDPELRPTGGTPIGKTLFYVGEYLRNQVVIDGKKCNTDKDCNNVNYLCKGGVCKDPARSCRSTVVVLFTDGGQGNSPDNYFAPWVQAKRLSTGLKCQSDKDCVGGSKCKELIDDKTKASKGKHCQHEFLANGGIDTYCTGTGKACLSGVTDPKDDLHCATQCVRHPQYMLTGQKVGSTGVPLSQQNNVLRSPDGKPFGVKVHVVDISAQANLSNSMSLSLAGNGKLLGADAADPSNFLKGLNSVFDIKNLKICGEDF